MSRDTSVAARLAAFAAILVVVFVAGLGLGRAVAPTDDAPTPTTIEHGDHVGAMP